MEKNDTMRVETLAVHGGARKDDTFGWIYPIKENRKASPDGEALTAHIKRSTKYIKLRKETENVQKTRYHGRQRSRRPCCL